MPRKQMHKWNLLSEYFFAIVGGEIFALHLFQFGGVADDGADGMDPLVELLILEVVVVEGEVEPADAIVGGEDFGVDVGEEDLFDVGLHRGGGKGEVWFLVTDNRGNFKKPTSTIRLESHIMNVMTFSLY